MNRLGRVFKRIGASSAAVAFSQALGSAFGYFKYNKARSLISLVGLILAFAATCSALSFYFSRAEGIVYDTAIADKNVILLQTENVRLSDIEELASKRGSHIERILPYERRDVEARYDRTDAAAALIATDSDFFERSALKLESGRFFNANEAASGTKSAVIGEALKNELFGDRDAVGSEIKINNQVFEITGVVSSKSNGGENADRYIFAPYTSVRLITDSAYTTDYAVFADSPRRAEDARAELENALSELSAGADRSFKTASDYTSGAVDSNIALAFSAIILLMYILGCAGLIYLMKNRVDGGAAEIRLRRLIGALNSEIKTQIVFETAVWSVFAWLIGAVVGTIVAAVFFLISPAAILISALIALVLGLLSGAAVRIPKR